MTNSKSERATEVARAVANERLEGLVVSEAAQRLADRYVVGIASAGDVAAKIRQRYGIAAQ